MTPPDIPARCPYDFFTSVTPSQLTLMDHSEELHPESPAHLKTTSQALLQAAEVLAPTIPVALADSTLLAITCKVSGHKTWGTIARALSPGHYRPECTDARFFPFSAQTTHDTIKLKRQEITGVTVSSGGRSPKRSRGEGSSRQSAIPPPTLDTLGIEFVSSEHRDRFATLSSRPHSTTKFADQSAFTTLGVADGVRRLFRHVGCEGLLSVYAPSYRRVTLEVLSTFFCCFETRLMKFRALNASHFISFDDVSEIFGCLPGNEGIVIDPKSGFGSLFSNERFWSQISDQSVYSARLAKGSSILHPCLRLAHRVLSSTLFCRVDSGTVSHHELFFLWSMVNNYPRISFDGGSWIAHKLAKLSESTSGEICCGGLITLILTNSPLSIDIPNSISSLEGITSLSIAALQRMQMIRHVRGQGYSCLVGPDHTHHTYLPCPTRTQVTSDTDWHFPMPQSEADDQESPSLQSQIDTLSARLEVVATDAHETRLLVGDIHKYFADAGHFPHREF
ncbi:hypothetical protein L6452_15939 [Arctium lappa]|uniref:Uncharacterized protein n=1 Tax=Arctium lappa TaxID=4217 RepID=A0ACB9CQ94_ARCLA|nr:hypothetical protein L6452_15939 [Arctium lappa]